MMVKWKREKEDSVGKKDFSRSVGQKDQKEVTFEWRPTQSEEASCLGILGRIFQTEGASNTKALT